MAKGGTNKKQPERIVRLSVKNESGPAGHSHISSEEKVQKQPARFRAAETIIQEAKKQHARKLFVMWSGVTFLMLLIAGAWLISIRSVFSEISTKVTYEENGFEDVKEIVQDFGAEVRELKKIMDDAAQASSTDINEQAPLVEAEADTASFNTLPELSQAETEESVEVKGIDMQDIEKLKAKLIELAAER